MVDEILRTGEYTITQLVALRLLLSGFAARHLEDVITVARQHPAVLRGMLVSFRDTLTNPGYRDQD